MEEILIKYFDENIKKIEKIEQGDWIDLRARETIEYLAGSYFKVPLNVAMKLPDGFEASILPRSSTFENWGIILANSEGVIDNSFSGDEDEWQFPAYALRDGIIEKGDRICQFRIQKKMPPIKFTVVDKLGKSRGGIGTTGKN